MPALPNWYAVVQTVGGKVLSYVSDDVPNFNVLPGGLSLSGPFPSLAAAQAAKEPFIPTAAQTTITNLESKASALWTLADVADWLKAHP